MSHAVIAHRTCPRDATENSLAGIRRAAELGADLVELDVRCTRDRIPILMHDSGTWRTTGKPLIVSLIAASTAARLRLGNGETVPTLEQALAALPPGLGVAVDVKDATAAPEVLDVVRSAGAAATILLWSQHQDVVRATAQEMPDLESSLLRDTSDSAAHMEFLEDAVEVGARGVSARWDALSPDFLDDAAGRGLSVYSWCRRPEALRDKLSLPLAGIVTDWPADVRRALDGMR